MSQIWNIILQAGSIGGLLSIVSATYLYFENRKFKTLEAEKDYEICRSELIELEDKIKQEEALIDDDIRSIIRGSKTREVFEWNKPALDKLEFEKTKIFVKYILPKSKMEAKVNYYKNLKDHSLFWFLKK